MLHMMCTCIFSAHAGWFAYAHINERRVVEQCNFWLPPCGKLCIAQSVGVHYLILQLNFNIAYVLHMHFAALAERKGLVCICTYVRFCLHMQCCLGLPMFLIQIEVHQLLYTCLFSCFKTNMPFL